MVKHLAYNNLKNTKNISWVQIEKHERGMFSLFLLFCSTCVKAHDGSSFPSSTLWRGLQCLPNLANPHARHFASCVCDNLRVSVTKCWFFFPFFPFLSLTCHFESLLPCTISMSMCPKDSTTLM